MFFEQKSWKSSHVPCDIDFENLRAPLFFIRLQGYWHRFFIHFHFYTYFQWNINIFFECILFIFENSYKKRWNLHEKDGMFIFHINYLTFGDFSVNKCIRLMNYWHKLQFSHKFTCILQHFCVMSRGRKIGFLTPFKFNTLFNWKLTQIWTLLDQIQPDPPFWHVFF